MACHARYAPSHHERRARRDCRKLSVSAGNGTANRRVPRRGAVTTVRENEKTTRALVHGVARGGQAALLHVLLCMPPGRRGSRQGRRGVHGGQSRLADPALAGAPCVRFTEFEEMGRRPPWIWRLSDMLVFLGDYSSWCVRKTATSNFGFTGRVASHPSSSVLTANTVEATLCS